MDPRILIWNLLHDGGITAVSDESKETLTMFVSIPYLRRRIPPLGDSFVLTLEGVRRIEFVEDPGQITSIQEQLETGIPEILRTNSESMPVVIEMTCGQLLLDFSTIRFALDTGQAIEFDAIAKVTHEYWTEWEAARERALAPKPDPAS